MEVDWGRRSYTADEFVKAWCDSNSVAEVQRKLGLRIGNPISLKTAAIHLGLSYLPGKTKTTWHCGCGKEFDTRRELYSHKRSRGKGHHYEYADRNHISCRFCGKQSTTTTGKSNHEKYCTKNPDKIVKIGNPHTESSRAILSKLMTERHKANIANRWKNPHLYESYPEKFFALVVENEFLDKGVTREYHIGKYFIDFAWVDKKLAIEIDGEQHYRYHHQMVSDEAKDLFLESQGWKVLRIRFKDMYKSPKEYIETAYNFIHH